MTIWDCAAWEPSGPSKVAVAKLSNLPVVDWDAPVTVPVIVNEVVAPAFNAPRFLHTSPAGTLAQSVAVLETKVKSAPRSSRMTKLLALAWPLLVAVIVYWKVSPVSTVLASPPETDETYLVS